MIESGAGNSNSFHLAGIIPIAGQASNINLGLPNCMAPVGENYTALELAVVQCAYAGCETIWIVCNDDTAPIIKHRLGDYVEDPVWRHRGMSPYPSEHRIEIPIFYVPIHPNDRDKRDCHGWSVLHGALTAYHVSRQMSKWVVPDRYFVAFSTGIYDPTVLRSYRKEISSTTGFYLATNGETIQEGHPISFTFDAEDFKRFRRDVRQKGTGGWYAPKEGEKYPSKRLPIEKRYSARHFSLDIVFGSAIMEGANKVEAPWFHPISDWEHYRKFLASPEAATIERPDNILPVSKFNPIGIDIEKGE
tara:strand:+ start:1654 stop:2565 length:912 start_codon:yes stop_codon:yes gene_type:complete